MTPQDRALKTMGTRAFVRMGNEAQRKLALARAESYRWFIEPLVRTGWSYETIRKTLEAHRLKTPSGEGRWTREMVRRIVNRLEITPEARAA